MFAVERSNLLSFLCLFLKLLRDLNKIAREKDLLLFFDEVQCGVGRTGKFLAVEWVKELKPNLVSIAKGIGGGFPVGALLLDKKTTKYPKRAADKLMNRRRSCHTGSGEDLSYRKRAFANAGFSLNRDL